MVSKTNGVGRKARSKHRRGTTMNYYVGIDVSLEASSVCVVDSNGKIVCESKVRSEPDALIAWLSGLNIDLTRIGLEAGPLSQWLYAAIQEAGFAVELLETRHVRNALKTMPVKTDRNDARGIAQLMPGSARCTASRWPRRRRARCSPRASWCRSNCMMS